MRVLEKIKAFRSNPKRPLVLALGNFDGIHLGHKRLLDYVVRQAKEINGQAAVFTFREHPQRVLHPEHAPESLQSTDQKLMIFKECGIDICFLQKFSRKFSALSAEDFIEKILVKQLGTKEICLGYNARFGRGRAGDADLLRALGLKFGFQVCQMKPVMRGGSPVSSTAVREAVRCGKVERAADFLGRPWSVAGKVMKGKSRGHKMGFPTANLKLGDYVQPARGVYAVYAQLFNSPKTRLSGVLNYGIRPTFGGARDACFETHLFDFKKNIYKKKIEIFFLKRLREEKKFSSELALKKQIKKDIQRAKSTLKQKG